VFRGGQNERAKAVRGRCLSFECPRARYAEHPDRLHRAEAVSLDFGFAPFAERSDRLFLPLATFRTALRR
jgi:hypothetical protein